MKPATSLRAAAYIRVSSEEQLDGHSLDAQRRAIQAACAERGWQVVGWYTDEGVSAHTDDVSKRPAFHQLVRDAEARRFDAVVVHKLDRFARSVVVALSTFKRLNELGISFLSLSEQGMDFTTPMGKVMFGMLALLAEYYSENLGVEIKKGKAERYAKGLHNGLVPFGYRSVDGDVAEPDPGTRDGVVLAFELAAKGASYATIAQALNARGYRTAGNMRRGVFTKDTVRDMLANRFYLGELPVFEPGVSRRVREWRPGQQVALVDVDTFTAVRAAVERRTVGSRADRRNASVYSLSGLLRCVHCGERMRVVRTEKGRIRYHCRSRAQGLGCSGKGSFLDVYEDQVVADLAAFELPADWKDRVLAEAQQSDDHDDVEVQRQQLEARLKRLRELYSWGDVSREEYHAQRDTIEQQLARLVPVEQPAAQLDALRTYLESLPAAWADASAEQRNQLANIIYEEVWVDGAAVEYVKPRPELEPLFQVRAGASQPRECLSHSNVGSGDPDGERSRMTQQWDFPVDEPVSLATRRQHRLTEHLPSIGARLQRGETLRAIAAEYDISHEALRQALRRCGHATRPSHIPDAAPRRRRIHRVPGRGRSTALTPDEVGALLLRHHAGESIRSLVRATGVSHETIRRVLREVARAGAGSASA